MPLGNTNIFIYEMTEIRKDLKIFWMVHQQHYSNKQVDKVQPGYIPVDSMLSSEWLLQPAGT